MIITVHLKSGKTFRHTDVEVIQDVAHLAIHYTTGAYSVIPLMSIDWYDVEFQE